MSEQFLYSLKGGFAANPPGLPTSPGKRTGRGVKKRGRRALRAALRAVLGPPRLHTADDAGSMGADADAPLSRAMPSRQRRRAVSTFVRLTCALVVPRRSSLNVGHAAFRARGEVIARALCRPGTSSRSPWLHPASRRAVAAHVG
jgi:hypothetical protein